MKSQFSNPKRLTLNAVRLSSQRGFTALGMFLAILIMLILMSATGYFIPPKSPVEDTNVYTGRGINGSDNPGLQMKNILFEEPTATLTPTPDNSPTNTPTPSPTPDSLPTNTPTPSPTFTPDV